MASNRDALESAYRALEERGREHLLKEGVRRKDIAFLRSADFRYEGQEYQINCDMPGGKADKAAVRKAFDAAYLRQYGHANPEARMEVVDHPHDGDRQARPPGQSGASRRQERCGAPSERSHFGGKAIPTAIVRPLRACEGQRR